MAFLEIMGWGLDIMHGEAVEGHVEIGDRHRAFDGTMLATRRAVKREWEFLTGPYIQSEATAIRKLLQGEGHHWSFDTDLYSDKGLTNHAGTVTSVAGGKFNNKADVASAAGQWATGLTGEWTVLVYRDSDGAGDWKYYGVTDDGDEWEDAVKGNPDTSWLSVDGTGDVNLAISGTNDYDDLVALPYRAPDAMIEAWHAETVAFPALPQLRVGGDFIPDTSLTVVCEVLDMPYRQVVLSGSLQSNAQQIRFRMREV